MPQGLRCRTQSIVSSKFIEHGDKLSKEPSVGRPGVFNRPTDHLGASGNGQFAAGNPGGPGNPFGKRVTQLRKLLLESVSDDDLKLCVEALVREATEGDIAAIRLVLQYTIGKPHRMNESVDYLGLPDERPAAVAGIDLTVIEPPVAQMDRPSYPTRQERRQAEREAQRRPSSNGSIGANAAPPPRA